MTTRKKSSVEQEAVSFETSLEQLETIVQKMESGDISLEESLKAFEDGIALTRRAQKSLTEAEQKVRVLLEANGEMIAEEFQEPEDDE